jgi:hypothetical protein
MGQIDEASVAQGEENGLASYSDRADLAAAAQKHGRTTHLYSHSVISATLRDLYLHLEDS